MLLDKAFSTTLKNFSTFFLVVASITVPLHVAYSFYFRDVLALSDIHEAIGQLPPAQPVGGVTAEGLERARLAYLGLCALEVASLPLLWRATSRVIALDRAGRLPSALRAWLPTKIRDRPNQPQSCGERLGAGTRVVTVFSALAFSVAVWFLAERIGLLLIELVPNHFLFMGLALVRSVSLALAAPFPLVAAIVALRSSGVSSTV